MRFKKIAFPFQNWPRFTFWLTSCDMWSANLLHLNKYISQIFQCKMRFVSCAVSHWKIAKRSRSSWAIIIRFFPLSQNPHVIRGQKFGGLTPHKRLRYFRKGFSDNFKQRSFYAKPRQSSGSWMHNETATFGHSFRSPCQNCSYASGGKLGFKHCQSTRNGGMYDVRTIFREIVLVWFLLQFAEFFHVSSNLWNRRRNFTGFVHCFRQH